MRYKQILLGLILFVLLGGFLQITSKFHFFYIEQLQLFQFSGDYLADKISNPGGLSLIIVEFLTQFFITPYAGPFIIAAILTSIGLTMRAIIRHCHGPIKNYLYLTYLNRALAEKGELADRMFAFDQHGPQGLLASWNKTFTVSTLLSDAYFTLGEIALSQEMAFEGYVTVIGAGNPRNLQRLVQTNLIYGTYPIAEKYISILEKTYAYHDWAKRHRGFLYNDKAIEADPVLGPKRKALPKESNLSGINGLEHDLLIRAEQDPENQLPIQFTGAIYLLSKDMKAFQRLIEKYYGTPVLPSLPVSFQEAVILLAEKDVDYWKRFNVSGNVIRKFAGYRNLVVQNRNNPQLPQLIKKSFGDTYWSYYTLK